MVDQIMDTADMVAMADMVDMADIVDMAVIEVMGAKVTPIHPMVMALAGIMAK